MSPKMGTRNEYMSPIFRKSCDIEIGMGKPSEGDLAYGRVIGSMTPTQKLKAWTSLYWTARSLKAAGIRMKSPHLTEEEVEKEVREAFLYATD